MSLLIPCALSKPSASYEIYDRIFPQFFTELFRLIRSIAGEESEKAESLENSF
jgi:hypothetical protein